MNNNKNCQWRIARRPSGNVVHEDFEYHENEIPKIENLIKDSLFKLSACDEDVYVWKINSG